MHIVLTIVGRDQVGIIAKISKLLAEHQVNIMDINQTIMQDIFNMVLVGDMAKANVSVQELNAAASALGKEIGVEIRVQSEDIFTAMHQI